MKILEDLEELEKIGYEFQKINRKRIVYRRRLIGYRELSYRFLL